MSAAALIYDFIPALTALDPHHHYSTTPLSGGLVNITVRIHISDTTGDHECVFGHVKTVVAKYAPAYVAAWGESAPFSQYRQVIEARALALLSQPSFDAYIQSTVTIPKLIHHDPALNILLMSDLGDAPTLDHWLCSESTNLDNGVIEDVGRRFGEFFARLGGIYEHSKTQAETFPRTTRTANREDADQGNGNESLDLVKHFSNPSTYPLLLSVAILAVEPNLVKCGIDPAEASSLCTSCLEAYERKRKPNTTKVFGLGDSWPKSLLVGGSINVTKQELQLGVVDWEFADVVEPLADLTQLCAHLYLLYRTSSADVKPRVRAYTLAMLRAHHAQTPEWQYALQHRVDAWRLLGQEIVNNAVETDWWDGDEARRQVEMKELGRRGADFIRDAEKRGAKEGILFEEIFDGLG